MRIDYRHLTNLSEGKSKQEAEQTAALRAIEAKGWTE